MGRVKLKVERLVTSANCQATYSKRKNGLVKKANELSVLCDVDLFLVLFSPSGKTVVWTGRNGTCERTIARLVELTPQERVKRKVDTFEALKRAYKKSDHNVNGQDFFAASYRTTEDWNMQAKFLRARLSEAKRRLRDWNNMHKTDSVQVLEPMEDHMRKLIDEIHAQKENVGNQQYLAPGCSYQVQNQMCHNLGAEQQVQHSSWVNNDNNQHMVSLAVTNLLPQRGTELSAGTSSFSGSFGTVSAGTASTWQERSILSELLRTQSLRNELINTDCLNNDLITEFVKLMKPSYLTNQLTKHDGFMNELVRAESLRNEGENSRTATNELLYTFSSFSETTFQSPQQMNVQQSVDNFCADGNFVSPQPGYDPNHSNWASTSGGYDPNPL